jgi:hypothetical protein
MCVLWLQTRLRVIKQADEIMFTQNLLLQQMKMATERPTVSEQLSQELASMTEAEINPAVKILQEWQKNKQASFLALFLPSYLLSFHIHISMTSSVTIFLF